MYSLSKLYDIKHPKEKSKKDADKAQKDGYVTVETFNAVSNGYTVLKEELEEKEVEMRLLRNLASTGLIITSFSHELKNFKTIAETRSDTLIGMLKGIISEEDLLNKGYGPYDNPYRFAKELKIKDQQIKSWLEFSINSISNYKKDKTWIHLDEYFKMFYSTWFGVTKELNIKLSCDEGFVPQMCVYASVMDFDTIFNNLISNSIYAIKEKKDIDNREIKISGTIIDDTISIKFLDTGKGLDKKYKDNPSLIFDAFESSKVDKNGVKIGTGLGLYIVKSTLGEYKNSEIRILPVNDGFCIEIKIKNGI